MWLEKHVWHVSHSQMWCNPAALVCSKSGVSVAKYRPNVVYCFDINACSDHILFRQYDRARLWTRPCMWGFRTMRHERHAGAVGHQIDYCDINVCNKSVHPSFGSFVWEGPRCQCMWQVQGMPIARCTALVLHRHVYYFILKFCCWYPSSVENMNTLYLLIHPCMYAKLTVLEIRMVINSAAVQQGMVNATRAMCSYLAPYEEECRWGCTSERS